MANVTVTMTLTPEEQTALYDALVLRAQTLEGNLPGSEVGSDVGSGSDRARTMHQVAAVLIDQMGYPVPFWMSERVSEAVRTLLDV
jgi:hypothetical protein